MWPAGTPWVPPAGAEIPAPVQELHDEVAARPAGQWLKQRYAHDRRRVVA